MKSMVNVDWNKIDTYSDEEISYFLFLENKSLDAICKIRKLDKNTVQNHIISGKIKYRFLVKSSNISELFMSLVKAGKDDRILFIKSLDDIKKKQLIRYIRENYSNMSIKIREKAIWILGEFKNTDDIDILIKASVNNSVNVRRMAISAMNKTNSIKCEDALMRALEDENPQVVLYAIKALKNLKSRKAIVKIKDIKKITKKDYILREIENYINEIER